jgi:phenylalanyl-tRNA synthetase beta chain
MKLSLKWLREFVPIDASADDIARRLSVAGLEVENIERHAPSFSGVVTAHVLDVQKHPNADRLSLCQVDAGPVGKFQVVCGAPNVKAGMFAALAQVGARLAGVDKGQHGDGHPRLEDVKPLEAAVIRGVRSEGMLCSERELGLSSEHAGIIALQDQPPLGIPLEHFLGLDDTVLDIAVLANRGDCLSVLGLAREVSALFGIGLRGPKPRTLKIARQDESGSAPADAAFPVEMTAPELCPRYAALKMTKVKIGPSPAWMRRRLEICGMRGLNNVVDATNYVMLELGQPLHAFDLAKIAGGKIVVRRAGDDREFVTLDNLRRELRPDDLLIADAEKALAIAGVMGGLNSEVSENTDTILLESAFFEPMAVARTARRLGLRSEASYRFERGVDRNGQVTALFRVAQLLREYAHAREDGLVADYEPLPAPRPDIRLDLKRMASLLGVEVPAPEVKRRLLALGAMVKRSTESRNVVLVKPPSYRSDINEAADLAEEVARLTGLDDIPATLPTRAFAYAAPNREREFFRATREIMLGAGMSEMDTIAFTASADNDKFTGIGAAGAIRVHNPLSEELRQMRLSLLPGLLQALRFNLNRQAADFHAFEIAKVYSQRGGTPFESYHLGVLSYGDYSMAEIGKPAVKASFFTMKGALEIYFAALGIAERVTFKPPGESAPRFLHPGRSAEIALEGELLGYLGELHPQEAMERDLSEPCVVSELDLEKLVAYGFSPRTTIEPPPRFPAIRRDLALVLDREFPAELVVKTVREAAAQLLESAAVFDVYEGGSIAQGKKSVALALTYRAKDRTLTDEEVNRVHAALVEQARTRLGAELRQ